MEYLNLVLRWLHILSAITLVGGVLYVRFAVVPLLESLEVSQAETIGAALRKNWARFLMISIALLLATGITNMVLIPRQYEFPEEAPNYSMLVGIKFLLALPVFYIVSVLNGRSNTAAKFRQKSRLWLNIAVVLSVLIVCLGGFLRYLPRTPKSEESAPAAAARFDSSLQMHAARTVFAANCSRKA